MTRVRGALHRAPHDPVEAPPAVRQPLASWDEAELAEGFASELEAVGGRAHRAATLDEARRVIGDLVAELGGEPGVIVSSDALVREVLDGVEVGFAAAPAEAGLGITGVLCAIASTGTLVLAGDVGRQASLLPMNHLALVRSSQIVPGMAEALARHAAELPSAWIQATGPSRTADIELTLTTGVHGPGVVDVVLIAEGRA